VCFAAEENGNRCPGDCRPCGKVTSLQPTVDSGSKELAANCIVPDPTIRESREPGRDPVVVSIDDDKSVTARIDNWIKCEVARLAEWDCVDLATTNADAHPDAVTSEVTAA
jgi:hypothetical protein